VLEKSTQLKINKSCTELPRPEGDQSTKWGKGLAVGRLRTKRILEMSKGISQLSLSHSLSDLHSAFKRKSLQLAISNLTNDKNC